MPVISTLISRTPWVGRQSNGPGQGLKQASLTSWLLSVTRKSVTLSVVLSVNACHWPPVRIWIALLTSRKPASLLGSRGLASTREYLNCTSDPTPLAGVSAVYGLPRHSHGAGIPNAALRAGPVSGTPDVTSDHVGRGAQVLLDLRFQHQAAVVAQLIRDRERCAGDDEQTDCDAHPLAPPSTSRPGGFARWSVGSWTELSACAHSWNRAVGRTDGGHTQAADRCAQLASRGAFAHRSPGCWAWPDPEVDQR